LLQSTLNDAKACQLLPQQLTHPGLSCPETHKAFFYWIWYNIGCVCFRLVCIDFLFCSKYHKFYSSTQGPNPKCRKKSFTLAYSQVRLEFQRFVDLITPHLRPPLPHERRSANCLHLQLPMHNRFQLRSSHIEPILLSLRIRRLPV